VSRTTEDPATAPNPTHSAGEAVAPVRGHGCLDHFQRLYCRKEMMISIMAQCDDSDSTVAVAVVAGW
jgi:hypothetical protein